MWYETLPFAGVMLACVFLTQYAHIPYNLAVYRQTQANRWTNSRFEHVWMLRDARINGNSYVAKGLETIED